MTDRSPRFTTVPERVKERQRAVPGEEGGEAGALGQASRGSPPPSRGLQTRPLRSVRSLVGRSVGRWVSGLQLGSLLSCSEVGGTRERSAHLSRPERNPSPRSVGSSMAPRPAALSGLGAPVGALPGIRRAPRS